MINTTDTIWWKLHEEQPKSYLQLYKIKTYLSKWRWLKKERDFCNWFLQVEHDSVVGPNLYLLLAKLGFIWAGISMLRKIGIGVDDFQVPLQNLNISMWCSITAIYITGHIAFNRLQIQSMMSAVLFITFWGHYRRSNIWLF